MSGMQGFVFRNCHLFDLIKRCRRAAFHPPHPTSLLNPPNATTQESRDFPAGRNQPYKLKIFKHKIFFFFFRFALSYAINYSGLEVQILLVSNGVCKCVCVVKVSSSQRKLQHMPLLPVCFLQRLIYQIKHTRLQTLRNSKRAEELGRFTTIASLARKRLIGVVRLIFMAVVSG